LETAASFGPGMRDSGWKKMHLTAIATKRVKIPVAAYSTVVHAYAMILAMCAGKVFGNILSCDEA
jgi:hypothetical protein